MDVIGIVEMEQAVATVAIAATSGAGRCNYFNDGDRNLEIFPIFDEARERRLEGRSLMLSV
jgi:hypothetical protein